MTRRCPQTAHKKTKKKPTTPKPCCVILELKSSGRRKKIESRQGSIIFGQSPPSASLLLQESGLKTICVLSFFFFFCVPCFCRSVQQCCLPSLASVVCKHAPVKEDSRINMGCIFCFWISQKDFGDCEVLSLTASLCRRSFKVNECALVREANFLPQS